MAAAPSLLLIGDNRPPFYSLLNSNNTQTDRETFRDQLSVKKFQIVKKKECFEMFFFFRSRSHLICVSFSPPFCLFKLQK